jgi:hypothetical protein
MKHKLTTIILALAAMGVALATQANADTITFNFQENGSNLNLGPTSTFTENSVVVGPVHLTASGFLTAGGPTDLYAKNLGAGETGLGTPHDPSGINEIVTDDFVQLTLPTMPSSTFNMVLASSVEPVEQELVYFNTVSGTLTGATLIGTLTSDGTVTVPAGDQLGFIDITAGKGHVLLGSATVTVVPEPCSLAFLALGAGSLLTLRRRFSGALLPK